MNILVWWVYLINVFFYFLCFYSTIKLYTMLYTYIKYNIIYILIILLFNKCNSYIIRYKLEKLCIWIRSEHAKFSCVYAVIFIDRILDFYVWFWRRDAIALFDNYTKIQFIIIQHELSQASPEALWSFVLFFSCLFQKNATGNNPQWQKLLC